MTGDTVPMPLAGRRVWVAGHRGMVGSALVRRLATLDIELLLVERRELDLRDAAAVDDWVASNRPDIVVLAAAKVGGIRANARFPADFLFENLAIQQAVIGAAARQRISRLLMLGSSCIYPKHTPQPIDVSQLLAGPLEPTNQWYAVAKITGIKLAEAFRRQHGLDFISAIPASLYGPGDNFDIDESHVIPGLMRKAHEAMLAGKSELCVWGTGTPLREFLHVDDLAAALIFLLEHYSAPEPINVGSGHEVSIRHLAGAICETVRFDGTLRFDPDSPDGTPRRVTDCGPLASLGWRPMINLEEGLADTYRWFLNNVADREPEEKSNFNSRLPMLRRRPSPHPAHEGLQCLQRFFRAPSAQRGQSDMTKNQPTRPLIPQVQPWLGPEETTAVTSVLHGGWLTEGPVTAAFAERLNQLTGAPYGEFAPNGTLALALGLLALDIGASDEVLVPDITFVASATAVFMVGARPVFVDVLPDSYQIDVADARARVTAATRAIMPVHLYGSACDMQAITAFADEYGLKVIEDAAQGIGVHFDGRHVGTIGDIGCFSFSADKTITTGEGGYVVCRSPAIHERIRYLRNQGRLNRGSFIHQSIGFNFRITDLQAAIGVAQIDRLDLIIERKRKVHERYERRLSALPQVSLIARHPLSTHVPFRVVLIAERAQALMDWLTDRQVQCRSFFYPLHRQPCFAGLPDASRAFHVADHGHDNGFCLPVHPTLADDDIDYICDAIHSFYNAAAS